jgi:hypothetical protein
MPIYAPHMTDADFDKLVRRPSFANGSAREVYEVPSDTSVVVKRVRTAYPGSNMVEWFIWNAVKSSSLVSIFGECFSISHTGQYLMMERLDDLAQIDYADVPKMPDWLNDRKPSAFGKAGTAIRSATTVL